MIQINNPLILLFIYTPFIEFIVAFFAIFSMAPVAYFVNQTKSFVRFFHFSKNPVNDFASNPCANVTAFAQ